MSERRRARVSGPFRSESGIIPVEFGDVSHPIWHDEAALLARFPDLMDDRVLSRLRMGAPVYHPIIGKWAMANGYESDEYPGTPDWRALWNRIRQV